MFLYKNKIQYPVNIKKKDLKMAKYLLTQYGGPNGELGAALRYFNQRYTMPDNRGKSLLTDIACEELGHVEMITLMVHQLLRGATPEELDAVGMGSQWVEHALAPFPTDSNGVPFVANFVTTGDPLADLSENMAAEEKARATYEHLIDMTDDEAVLGPLIFLRGREIVHFARFKELYDLYKKEGY